MTPLEKLREELLAKIEQSNAGKSPIAVNVIQGEGAGNSSCVVKKGTKGDKSYEVKVYSNDLDGASASVTEAIKQAIRLDAEISFGSNGGKTDDA